MNDQPTDQPSTLAGCLAQRPRQSSQEHTATMRRTPFDASESGDAVSYILVMLQRHGQLLDYLAARLRETEGAGYLAHGGLDADAALCLGHQHIEAAKDFLGDAFDHLAAARNHLGGPRRHVTED